MTNEELIEKTDKAIAELVYPKFALQKAYNYYNGIRDADQFKYLEERFGASTPTAIHFTPLIKKHIDVLIGEYLTMPILPKISCKDSDTISKINREKQLAINNSLVQFLLKFVRSSVVKAIQGNKDQDPMLEQEIKKVKDDLSENFISEYERTAQDVLDYIMQSRQTDLSTNLRNLILDLLITGYTYYKVEPTSEENNIQIRVLNPLNTFLDENIESPYVKNSNRVVVRSWLSKTELLNKYGKELSKEEVKLIEDKWQSLYDNSMMYVRMKVGSEASTGIMAGYEVTPGYPSNITGHSELIPVYEVEWLEVDKDFVMQRYETIRIGEEVYILKGKNDKVMRSVSQPTRCSLSVNGVYFLDRSDKPYSLMLACAHLQDQFDLLTFYRDNLIANSGTIGDWIDEALIPSHLGVNMPERIANWLALKKQGTALLNSSEEGRISQGTAPLNTIFNGYDDTVKAQAVQAIQLAIESIEATVSSITGVFRERLNGITAKDAVSNIQQGVNNSYTITRKYFHQMDLVVNEVLLDCLNLAKVVYKKGLTGVLILGDKQQKIFTALPEYFTITDHDIRILTTSDVVRDLETIKAVIPEFVKSGGLPPDIIFEALTSKSIPDIKHKIKQALNKQKEEGTQMQQLAQQVKELESQLKQASQQLQQANSKVEQLNQAKIQLEQQKLEMTNKVEWYKAQTERSYRETMAEEAKKRTQAEINQLYDGNPYNNKIKQIGQ